MQCWFLQWIVNTWVIKIISLHSLLFLNLETLWRHLFHFSFRCPSEVCGWHTTIFFTVITLFLDDPIFHNRTKEIVTVDLASATLCWQKRWFRKKILAAVGWCNSIQTVQSSRLGYSLAIHEKTDKIQFSLTVHKTVEKIEKQKKYQMFRQFPHNIRGIIISL